MENQLEKEIKKYQKFNIELSDFSNETAFNVYIHTIDYDLALVRSQSEKCNICSTNLDDHLMQLRYHNCTNTSCSNRSQEINRQCFKVRKCLSTNRIILDQSNSHMTPSCHLRSRSKSQSRRKRTRLDDIDSIGLDLNNPLMENLLGINKFRHQ